MGEHAMPNMLETVTANLLDMMESNRREREAILAESVGLANSIDWMDKASVEYRNRRQYRDAKAKPENPD
jgi:hypothetical protein